MDKIRKSDEVIVLTGKDKGKRGVVQQRVDADHVVVEGINVAKKAREAEPDDGYDWRHRRQADADSCVQRRVVQCGDWQGRSRVASKIVDGKKVRVFKSSGEVVKA